MSADRTHGLSSAFLVALAGACVTHCGEVVSVSSGGPDAAAPRRRDAASDGTSQDSGARCVIDGGSYSSGAVDPSQQCQVCAPAESTTSWSAAADGMPCGDGKCTGGRCLVTLDVETLAPTVVNADALVVTATKVYFGGQGDGVGSDLPPGPIWSVGLDLSASSAHVLANEPGVPTAIAVDDSSVYWTTYYGGTVLKVPLSGGLVTTLASAQAFPYGLVVVGSNLYWSNLGTQTVSGGPVPSTGSIVEVPVGGGAATTLAASVDEPADLATDGENVYWTTPNSVVKLEVASGNSTTLASGQTNPSTPAVDDSSVYWLNEDANPWALVKVAVEGGVPSTVVSGDGSQQSLEGLAIDSTSIYWGFQGVSETPWLIRAAKTGGPPSTLASSEILSIAVGATSVYWTGGGTVQKLTPK
jgi:hypothetical protein